MFYFSFAALRWWRYRRRLGSPSWFPSQDHFRHAHGQSPATVFELQRNQVETESVPHLLRYEDKNSMWHSVEARLPFLDHRLVEFALNLPSAEKVSGGWTKFVLRRAIEDLLPSDIVWRKDKRGFEGPDALWFRQLRQTMIETVHLSPLLAQLSDGADSRFDGTRLSNPVLWRFYVTALWEREFGADAFA